MRIRTPLALAYHSVADVDPQTDPKFLVNSPKTLESQLRFLLRLGYTFRTAEEVADAGVLRSGEAVATFDDGWVNNLTVAAPLLERLGIRATFYVCPGLFETQHQDVSGEAGRLMSAAQVRELSERGHEVAPHTLTHPNLKRLGDAELSRELRDSKAAVEDLTGRRSRTFAYPFGIFADREVYAVREAGFELAWAWLPGPWRLLSAPRLPAPPRDGWPRLALKAMGIRRRQRLP
jgi:peptidoglycan/xylan/chitin deacetylase (PgdA/CDA1 family)